MEFLKPLDNVNPLVQIMDKIHISMSNFDGFCMEMNSEEVSKRTQRIIDENIKTLDSLQRQRINDELFREGPLNPLLQNEKVNEILINGFNSIFYEKEGALIIHNDTFLSHWSFESFIKRVCKELNTEISFQYPFLSGNWRGFRIQICSSHVTHGQICLSIRKYNFKSFFLNDLFHLNWGELKSIEFIKKIIQKRSNILVAGPTSSGKTTVINSILSELPINERCLLLEDTKELELPNPISMRLVSRTSQSNELNSLTLGDLVKCSLRLRPDRIIVGEIRGEEAKDLLLALSSGHTGSLSSIHARSASEALERLEVLVQMGAPQWNQWVIKNLIFRSIDYIILLEKSFESPTRRLGGIYKPASLEEKAILIDKIY